MMRQLLDVVNQAIQIPLRVHLWLGSQREAVEPLVVPKVGEHRLDDGDASPVEPAAPLAVNRPLHAFGVAKRRALALVEEGDLADRRALGMSQAALAYLAGHAITLRSLEFVMPSAFHRARAAA